MRQLRRAFLVLGLLGILAVIPHRSAFAGQVIDPSTLNPPPPSFETCMATGNGAICKGARTQSYGPTDTGIVCGSGPTAFDIFDQGAFDQHAIRYYDQNGNLTRRAIYDNYAFGQWSNPLSGAVVSYKQVTNETDVLAVPGDFNSATSTYTGQNIYRAGHGAPVLISAGRTVQNFDGSVIYSESGPDPFTDFFLEGDASAFAAVCAALA
jgi:hypothetical protein